MLRFQTPAVRAAGVQARQLLVTASAAPRIELHTSKISKYLDVVFRYSLLICSLSIIAVMGLFFYELTYALEALDCPLRLRFFCREYLGPGLGRLRRDAVHLWDAGLFAGGAGAGGSAGGGSCGLCDRAVPAIFARHHLVHRGAAGGDSFGDLRPLGNLRPGAASCAMMCSRG